MNRPIRVGIDAHTLGRRQTGNERFTVELADALSRRDDVEVIAYLDRGVSWPTGGAGALKSVELRARQPQLRIPFELPVRARRDRLDLLQVNYVGPPVAGTPVVVVVHDLSFEDRPELFATRTRLRLKSLVRLSVRQAAAVVAVSDFTRQRLLDIYRLPGEVVWHVPEGVGHQWRPRDASDARRVLAGSSVPARFVLAVGTSHPRKNLARLVKAVARLRADGQHDLQLIMAGPAPADADDPLSAAISEGWAQRLGYVSDPVLRALYSTADVFAYVSLYEGFGLPVLEALACGAVVVASSTTAVGEAAGDACVLVDPEDEESIASGLRRALSDRSLRARLRRRAPKHLANFSWDACAAAMVEVYRFALSRLR